MRRRSALRDQWRDARRTLPILAALVLAPALSRAQEQPRYEPHPTVFQPGPFTLGEYLGFGFGSVTWVSVTGEVGHPATDRLWVGTTARFQYTDDQRYEPAFTSIDYGFGAFSRKPRGSCKDGETTTTTSGAIAAWC